MKYAIGCDPNAMEMKLLLAEDLKSAGHSVTDMGSEDVVYANVAIKVAEAVASGEYDKGVLVCGTGIGMNIAANKVKGAYAALVTDVLSAEKARTSNNANIICMGANTLATPLARKLLEIWDRQEFDATSPSAPKVDAFVNYDKARK